MSLLAPSIDVHLFSGARMYRGATWETGGEHGPATSHVSFDSDAMDDNVLPSTVSSQVDRLGGGSVTVWGGAISYTGRSELVFIQGNRTAVPYQDEILCCHNLPIFGWTGRKEIGFF